MASALKTRRRLRKPERLQARVLPNQKRLIERAARLRGATVTEFIVTSAQQAAVSTIKEYESLTLGAEAGEAFVRAIVNPPVPNAALRAAARRYRERMGP